LLDEGLEEFFAGRYAGEFEASLIQEFNASLPDRPAWL
jgi:hypothetical protein